jgi:3-hydroxyacyl-[acyl-carrier-protein] dehydratase
VYARKPGRWRDMKFILIDHITELVPGERISAVKALSLAEEYLADHFPRFPVLPGVLMIEALVQAAACLVRATEDFAHSLVVLAEARNVTYKSFVSPGRVLEVSVQAKRIEAELSQFVGIGRCGDEEMVKAHLTLRHSNLADRDPALLDLDRKLIATARQQMTLLQRPG